jgi:hypothetical protein
MHSGGVVSEEEPGHASCQHPPAQLQPPQSHFPTPFQMPSCLHLHPLTTAMEMQLPQQQSELTGGTMMLKKKVSVANRRISVEVNMTCY